MSLTLPGGADRLSTERDDAHRRYHQAFAALDRVVNETVSAAAGAGENGELLSRLATFQSLLVQFLQQLTPYVDTKLRVIEQAASDAMMTANAAQRAAIAAQRSSGPRSEVRGPGPGEGPRSAGRGPASPDRGADDVSYIAFEDCFRGSEEEIRQRQSDYVPLFAGATDVLDVGCGRGEFLALLKEAGVPARGIDLNEEMVEICRGRGLTAERADLVDYLRGLPDETLGGLFAAQVVEHLRPAPLMAFLREASRVLRPRARIVLETINPTCWVAFFDSYIRDLTHVKPLHPETLKFLAIASGFTDVRVQFRTPVPESDRLKRLSAAAVGDPRLAELIEAFNLNMERLNDRLFTHLDYAVVGIRA
jgi:SAM-dependent methyltransferase